ncbi:MAG: metallophosphoesterase family protein [Verrucomicrobiota bacterium]
MSDESPAAKKRVLAIGDIHGCLTALQTLAEHVPFRPESDLLVTLGDHVDRGPDSKGVIDWLLAWKGVRVSLRGNHEIMMQEARGSSAWVDGWRACGGAEALASYGGGIEDVPQAHWDLINQLLPYYETETHFFVHANVLPELDLADQSDSDLYWSQYIDPPRHKSGKKMVCGHTSQKDGLPKYNGSAACIDTWVYGKGWLTCLDVERSFYWQANQQGEVRTGILGLDGPGY